MNDWNKKVFINLRRNSKFIFREWKSEGSRHTSDFSATGGGYLVQNSHGCLISHWFIFLLDLNSELKDIKYDEPEEQTCLYIKSLDLGTDASKHNKVCTIIKSCTYFFDCGWIET